MNLSFLREIIASGNCEVFILEFYFTLKFLLYIIYFYFTDMFCRHGLDFIEFVQTYDLFVQKPNCKLIIYFGNSICSPGRSGNA